MYLTAFKISLTLSEDKMEKQINEKIIEMDREYPFLF